MAGTRVVQAVESRGLASAAGRRAVSAAPGTPARAGTDGDVVVRYEAVYRRAEAAVGERRLLLAVLEDGIRTLMKYAHGTNGRARTLRREALTWIRAEACDDVFAFERICEALAIDARRLRGRVLALTIRNEPSGTALGVRATP